MTLPKSLTTVTTFSKLVALLLLILLPFIGFYLGMEFERKVGPAEQTTTQTTDSTPTSSPTPTTSATPTVSVNDLVTVIGTMNTVIGDPQPGTGQSARSITTITDENGITWQLTFDKKLFAPEGNLLQYNSKRVKIEGKLIDSTAKKILVHSLVVLP